MVEAVISTALGFEASERAVVASARGVKRVKYTVFPEFIGMLFTCAPKS
jgi:hypothetical protein